MIFKRQDRAYACNAVATCLQTGQLYCVADVRMASNGEQTLNLVGHPNDWYNSIRFARVADPSPRKWPAQ